MKNKIVLLFTCLELATVNSAFNSKFNLWAWFLPAVVYAVFRTIGICICRSIKIR